MSLAVLHKFLACISFCCTITIYLLSILLCHVIEFAFEISNFFPKSFPRIQIFIPPFMYNLNERWYVQKTFAHFYNYTRISFHGIFVLG